MTANARILIIDDNPAIHEDFRKILAPPTTNTLALNALEDELFGDAPPPPRRAFPLDSALQGRAGFELVESAELAGTPFALAFVDVRMPPGWDGVETARHLWSVSPRLQIVICTAYSDYSWEQISAELGRGDRLAILRKPFDPVEVQELAATLVEKWNAE